MPRNFSEMTRMMGIIEVSYLNNCLLAYNNQPLFRLAVTAQATELLPAPLPQVKCIRSEAQRSPIR